MPMTVVRIKTNITFDEQLYKDAKHAAVDDDRSLSDLVEEAVALYLKERKAAQKRT